MANHELVKKHTHGFTTDSAEGAKRDKEKGLLTTKAQRTQRKHKEENRSSSFFIVSFVPLW
jgi:hypothetical protein